MHQTQSRSGTILIIVAGISALMASLALTFIINARADVEEMEVTVRDAQARIMLVAACSYIMEASRIGWEPMNPPVDDTKAPTPVSTEHVEAFGWIDVRDGGLGPRIETGGITDADRIDTTLKNTDGNGVRYRVIDDNGNPRPIDKPMPANPPYDSRREGGQKFPIGVARRFPMHVLTRPPFAISPRVAENPVNLDAPDNGRSYLRNPDPKPAVVTSTKVSNSASGGVDWTYGTANEINEWAKGDTIGLMGSGINRKHVFSLRQDSVGKSWFRLLREKSGASFIVTCGAGGTLGYRDWSEVGTDQPLFFNDPRFFEALRNSEVRLWYRVEWNAATAVPDMQFLQHLREHAFEVGGVAFRGGAAYMDYSGQWRGPNMGGTIQMIQRLVKEPLSW
jgi:hypothetical protein